MDNCNPNSCPLEPRVEALEKANEQHSKTHREIFRRMNEVERDNAVQNANFNALTERLSGIDGTMKTLSSDIADARREISAALREISGISGKTKELEGLGEAVGDVWGQNFVVHRRGGSDHRGGENRIDVRKEYI